MMHKGTLLILLTTGLPISNSINYLARCSSQTNTTCAGSHLIGTPDVVCFPGTYVSKIDVTLDKINGYISSLIPRCSDGTQLASSGLTGDPILSTFVQPGGWDFINGATGCVIDTLNISNRVIGVGSPGEWSCRCQPGDLLVGFSDPYSKVPCCNRAWLSGISFLCSSFICPPGTYSSGSTCSPCAVKTFQDQPGQTVCKTCTFNDNTTTGASYCDAPSSQPTLSPTITPYSPPTTRPSSVPSQPAQSDPLAAVIIIAIIIILIVSCVGVCITVWRRLLWWPPSRLHPAPYEGYGDNYVIPPEQLPIAAVTVAPPHEPPPWMKVHQAEAVVISDEEIPPQFHPGPNSIAQSSQAQPQTLADSIQQLSDMRERGVLTDEEFQTAKASLIASWGR